MESSAELRENLKKLIVDRLNLIDVKVANSEQALQAFQSVATLAAFIEARRQPVG